MPPGQGLDAVVHPLDVWDQGCRWVNARVCGIKSVNVGQYQQKVCIHQVGNQCRQSVVVAEDCADFIHGHHVVFVEQWHHAQLQQALKGVADVEVGLAIGKVANGEQRLGHSHAVDGELLLIYLHQPALPHGGGHLAGAYVAGGRVPPLILSLSKGQGRAPYGYCPGGHQHHLGPLLP